MISPETKPSERVYHFTFTDGEASELAGLIGFALGRLAKDGLAFGGRVPMAVDSFFVQCGGYPYHHERRVVEYHIARVKSLEPKK